MLFNGNQLYSIIYREEIHPERKKDAQENIKLDQFVKFFKTSFAAKKNMTAALHNYSNAIACIPLLYHPHYPLCFSKIN